MSNDKILNRISDEARKNKYLRNEYEQFFYSLFHNKTKIEKIQETDSPTPDFRIKLYKSTLKTEVKGLDSIYEYSYDIFREVCEQIGLRDLIKQYAVDVEPFNLHREDRADVMKKLRAKLLETFNKEDPPERVVIKCSAHRNYRFILEQIEDQRLAYGIGKFINQTSNLRNALRANKQYEEIDFLTLINLSEENDREEYINNIFNPEAWMYNREDPDNLITVIRNKFFSRYQNIYFILIISPNMDCAYIAISPNLNDNKYSEILHLGHMLKQEGFKINISSINIDWVEF